MQDMNELRRMGMVSDEYMKELEASMEREQSLEQFSAHLDMVSGRPTQEAFKGSGGNGKPIPNKNKRKRKRKAQRKARRVAA